MYNCYTNFQMLPLNMIIVSLALASAWKGAMLRWAGGIDQIPAW